MLRAHRRIVYHVIPDQAILATDAYAVRPLLERIGPARPDIVVLHGDIAAGERALRNVQTRPAARVERMHVFDQLVRVRAAHFDVRPAVRRRRPCARAVDLLWDARREPGSQTGARGEDFASADLDVTQLHPAAVLTGAIHCGGVSLAIRHGPGDDERCATVVSGIAYGADFLILGVEQDGGLDEVLDARAQRKDISGAGGIE